MRWYIFVYIYIHICVYICVYVCTYISASVFCIYVTDGENDTCQHPVKTKRAEGGITNTVLVGLTEYRNKTISHFHVAMLLQYIMHYIYSAPMIHY